LCVHPSCKDRQSNTVNSRKCFIGPPLSELGLVQEYLKQSRYQSPEKHRACICNSQCTMELCRLTKCQKLFSVSLLWYCQSPKVSARQPSAALPRRTHHTPVRSV